MKRFSYEHLENINDINIEQTNENIEQTNEKSQNKLEIKDKNIKTDENGWIQS